MEILSNQNSVVFCVDDDCDALEKVSVTTMILEMKVLCSSSARCYVPWTLGHSSDIVGVVSTVTVALQTFDMGLVLVVVARQPFATSLQDRRQLCQCCNAVHHLHGR